MASSDPPPSVYEFHSFHINIGVGDGSIHLLVDVSKTDVKPQGKVVQAILIDGGEDHGEYVANIFSTVDRIKLEYEFPADDGDELKFDSIIVTHWDSDHYDGLIRFLRLGFVDGYEKANRVLADARIPFLRYSGDVPATTLYAPYWVDESTICGPCRKLRADPGMPRTADDSTGLTGNDEAWMKLNPGSLEEPESSDDEGSKKKKKKKAKKKITRPNWPRILRLKTGAKNLLGMNFLNGQMPTTKDQTELNTPQKLLNKNQPGDGKPGMYCVAVNNVMLGETDEADTNPPYPTSQLQRRPGDGSGGPPPFGPRPIIDNPLNFDENSVDKNVRSVSCIVLWKDGDGVRLSHYFAGDAMWTIEARIFDWIKAAKTFTVTAMKISHHGAVNATPLTFLDELDPGKLIVSAGKDIRHGHPRWELLFLVYCWILCDPAARLECFFSTNFPYCLTRDEKDSNRFEYSKTNTTTTVFTKLFLEKDKVWEKGKDELYDAYKEYQLKLQSYYETANALNNPSLPAVDLWTAFSTGAGIPEAVKGKDEWTQWDWIARKIEDFWPKLAAKGIDDRAFADTGGVLSGPSTSAVVPKEKILYIKLMSRNSTADGETIVIGCDGNELGRHIGRSRQVTTVAVTVNPEATVVVDVSGEPPVGAMAKLATSAAVSTVAGSAGGGKDDKDDIDVDDTDTDGLVRRPPIIPSPSARVRKRAFGRTPDSTNNDSTDSYYIYCSGTATSLGSSSATVLTAGSVLDQLVSQLHYKQMVFTAKPAAGSTTPTNFLTNDEWNLYFTACFDSAKFSATADSNGDLNAIQLSFDFPVSGGKNLVFSSGSAAILANFGQSATIPAPGMLTDPCILVFGLDTASTTAWADGISMASLLDYTGLENTASLMSSLTATLDMATAANRNAIWFTPWANYKTTVRLVFTAESDALKTFLGDIDSFTNVTCSDVSVVLRATHTMIRPGGISAMRNGTLSVLATCSIDISSSDTVSFELVLDVCQDSLGITLVTDATVTLSTIYDWLKSIIGLDNDFEINDWLQTNLNIKDVSIGLRRIFINLDTASTLSVSSVGVDIEVKWANASSSQPVVFLFTYTRWKGQTFGIFTGCIWCQPPDDLVFDYRKMLPEWEDWKDFHPICDTPAGYLDIQDLFPGIAQVTNIPKGMPTKIARANVQLSGTGILFDGLIVCPPPPKTKVPSLSFTSLELNTSYAWAGDLDLQFKFRIDLFPSSTSPFQDIAELRGDLMYEDSTWSVSASIDDFRVAVLYQLFETASRDTVMPLIEGLVIRTLDMEYIYGSGGEPSSFACTGILLLGPLELDLTFNHTKSSWEFFATLGSDQPETKTTLGNIIRAIIPDADLPDFAANVAIETPVVQLAAAKNSSEGVVFSLVVTDGDFSFMFAQHNPPPSKTPTKSKRVLKLAFKPFPSVPIPLIGEVAQPFEEISYLWVQDPASEGTTTPSGLTLDEVTQINQALKSQVLLYKDGAGAALTDVVIPSGSHLVLVTKTWQGTLQVLIDYQFQPPKKDPASTSDGNQTNVSTKQNQAAAEDDGDTGLGPDSVMVPLNSKQNGLTVENIGLQYVSSSKSIIIILDATFTLGPISFALLGFGLKLDISKGDLRNLPPPGLLLSGLGLGFDKPPIDIAGLFKVLTTDSSTAYEGGVVIGLPEYEFLGAGYYGDDSAGYKSVFAFAELVGPLLTLEFAELSGVKGGFGYNSLLTLPIQDNVASFPFVGASFRVQGNALGTLEKLFDSNWITSSQGDYWAAAGLRIDALQMLFVDAVFVCEFGHGLKLGLIADLVVHIPPPVSSEGRRFVYVNIGLLATIDLGQGILLVAGQVSRDSFLLDPACGLSGEFAFSYWFGPNTSAGQWVFTLGGYHPAFDRPSYYPKADRLAIAWTVDSNISISGQGYFAVTPKLCMGGGMLKAEYLNGDLEANFTAFADFMIIYDPFHFTADIGVTIYGRYSPWWLIAGPATAHVDASLHLEGPPLYGWVTVEFFGFQKTFYFGTQEAAVRDRDTLEQFYTLLQAADSTRTQPHLVTCESGQLAKSTNTSPTSKQADDWTVGRGKLSFRVSSPFAFGSATYNKNSKTAVTCDQDIYSIPMMLSGSSKIQSTLDVSISQGSSNITEVFAMTRVISNLPAALWGSYDQQTGDQANLLNGKQNAVVPLMAAVVLTAPPPQAPTTNILPFNIIDSMSKQINPDSGAPVFPSTAVDKYSVYWAPDIPDSDTDEQYEDVKTDWSSPIQGDHGRKETFFGFCIALGWSDDVELKTDAPNITLKKFKSMYASAPLIAGAITDYDYTA